MAARGQVSATHVAETARYRALMRPIQPMVAKNATTLAASPTGVLRERRLG